MQLPSKWGKSSWQNWGSQFCWLTVPESKWGHAAKTTNCYTRVKYVTKQQFNQGHGSFSAVVTAPFNKCNLFLLSRIVTEEFQHTRRRLTETNSGNFWVNERMFMKVNHQLQQLALYLLCVSFCIHRELYFQKEFLVRFLYRPVCIRRLNYQWTMKVKNHNALGGRRLASKTSEGICDEEQRIIFFYPGIIKHENNCRVCFGAFWKLFPLNIV